jgi:hypothetical protein
MKTQKKMGVVEQEPIKKHSNGKKKNVFRQDLDFLLNKLTQKEVKAVFQWALFLESQREQKPKKIPVETKRKARGPQKKHP